MRCIVGRAKASHSAPVTQRAADAVDPRLRRDRVADARKPALTFATISPPTAMLRHTISLSPRVSRLARAQRCSMGGTSSATPSRPETDLTAVERAELAEAHAGLRDTVEA